MFRFFFVLIFFGNKKLTKSDFSEALSLLTGLSAKMLTNESFEEFEEFVLFDEFELELL